MWHKYVRFNFVLSWHAHTHTLARLLLLLRIRSQRSVTISDRVLCLHPHELWMFQQRKGSAHTQPWAKWLNWHFSWFVYVVFFTVLLLALLWLCLPFKKWIGNKFQCDWFCLWYPRCACLREWILCHFSTLCQFIGTQHSVMVSRSAAVCNCDATWHSFQYNIVHLSFHPSFDRCACLYSISIWNV